MWLLYWEIYLHLLKCVCFESADGFFVHGFEEDQQKNEVMSVVCGAMFGEERVNNSVDLLSRVLDTFSVGQISALVAVILYV